MEKDCDMDMTNNIRLQSFVQNTEFLKSFSSLPILADDLPEKNVQLNLNQPIPDENCTGSVSTTISLSGAGTTISEILTQKRETLQFSRQILYL